MIASALYIYEKDIVENLEIKGGVRGFTRKSLEAKALALEKSKNWRAFNTVLVFLGRQLKINERWKSKKWKESRKDTATPFIMHVWRLGNGMTSVSRWLGSQTICCENA